MAHRPHIYLPGPWPAARLPVPDEVRHHLERVLRARELDVDYTDGAGVVGSGRYVDGIVTRGEERVVDAPEPRLVVAVAAPQSSDRQRIVVEKLAELGVDELVWLRTTHGGHRTPPQRRAEAWAAGALEQSRGAHLLRITGETTLGTLAARGRPHLAHPGSPRLGELAGDPVIVAVGPEGGFTDNEAAAPNVTCFGLGERILRTETAAIVAASMALERLETRKTAVIDD